MANNDDQSNFEILFYCDSEVRMLIKIMRGRETAVPLVSIVVYYILHNVIVWHVIVSIQNGSYDDVDLNFSNV